MTDPLHVVLKTLRERRELLKETVANGGCKDYGDYRNLCGELNGLAFAEREIIDLQRTMETYND